MIKIITTLAVALSLYGAQTIQITPEQASDLGIKTQKTTEISSIKSSPYNGTVMLDKKDIISISSNMESIVKEIYVSDFERVKRGQKLLTLKSNALLTLQREYIESIIQQESALENYSRNLKLEADGIISKKKLLASQKLKNSVDLEVRLNENRLLTNGFSSKTVAKLRTTHKGEIEQNIYAPKDGVIYKIDVNIGEYVQSDHMIMGIYADGKRFIEMSVPVKIVEEITIGDRCTFSKYSAKVSAIGNVVNVSSQSVQVRALIKDSKEIMINRVYGVKIHKSVDNAVKVKKGALVFQESSAYVFRQVEGGFEPVSVEIISEGSVCYIVKSSLHVGDRLAVSSTAALLSAMEAEDE